MRRRPGFAAVAVLSLALGIGGNAVIFGLFDGFVFHPFAYPDPDRLVTIGATFPRLSSEERFVEAISVPEYLDLRAAHTLKDVAAFDLGNRNVSGGDRPERVFTALAVTDLFPPFGLRPALGRGFTREELAPQGPAVAVISHRLWQGRFGGDPAIVGRVIRVNGRPTTVVGVMPPELLVLGTDLWLPMGAPLPSMPRNFRPLTILARLAPGATLDETNAELAALARQTADGHGAEFAEYDGWRLTAMPWATALMRDIRPAARLLVGAVALVLLIVCANLSNLLLARSSTRQREMTVRRALGAGEIRIAGHVLAEVAVLTLCGGALGLALAYGGLPMVVRLIPPELNTLGVTASISGRVMAWTALLTIGSALLVAVVPWLQFARADAQGLKPEARTATAGRAQFGLHHGLVVAEIALSVILLAGAGLLVRSLARLEAVEPGFDPSRVLTMRVTLPAEKYRGEAINRFFQQVLDGLSQLPGVKTAAFVSQFPPQGGFSSPFTLEGMASPDATIPNALVTAASDAHLAALGVPLIAGRTFTRADNPDAPRVALINEAFASRLLPGVPALGRRISVGPPEQTSPPMEIVGVVGSTRNRGLRQPPSPETFVPMPQQTINNQMFLIVRTANDDPAALLPAVRQQIAAIDPEQPIYAVRTLEDAVAADTFRVRFPAALLAVFAPVALTLAALGIYGVMSYAVSARTQEIGVRLAVGADRGAVVWLVLRQVLRLTAVGLALGLAGAIAGGRLLGRVLFEIRPADPVTLATVVLVLGSVALVAGWLPAARASRVDPASALRDE